MIVLPVIALAATVGTWLFYVQHQFDGDNLAGTLPTRAYAQASARGDTFDQLTLSDEPPQWRRLPLDAVQQLVGEPLLEHQSNDTAADMETRVSSADENTASQAT